VAVAVGYGRLEIGNLCGMWHGPDSERERERERDLLMELPIDREGKSLEKAHSWIGKEGKAESRERNVE